MHIRKLVIPILMFGIFICLGAWGSAVAAEGASKAVPANAATPGQEAKVTKGETTGGSLPVAVVPEKKFVFEPVLDGTAVHHNFIIQNKGNTMLKISKVKTG